MRKQTSLMLAAFFATAGLAAAGEKMTGSARSAGATEADEFRADHAKGIGSGQGCDTEYKGFSFSMAYTPSATDLEDFRRQVITLRHIEENIANGSFGAAMGAFKKAGAGNLVDRAKFLAALQEGLQVVADKSQEAGLSVQLNATVEDNPGLTARCETLRPKNPQP